MSRRYEILADYGLKDTEADNLSTSPYAIIAIWRHQYPVTFSRLENSSFTLVPGAASKLRERPIVLTDDLISVQVSHSKGNHLGTAAFKLRATLNYFTEFFPGDYVFVWMVNDSVSYNSVLQNIRDGKPCNGFHDGLKFFGKLNSIRKNINQSPTGTRTTTFSCSAASFSELDAGIYYEPYLGTQESDLATGFLKGTGVLITEVLKTTASDLDKGISANRLMPLLLGIFYGNGVAKNLGIETNTPDITQGLDNPDAFVVPDQVASVFLGTNQSWGSKPSGKFAYTDLLEFIHGVQQYEHDAPDSGEISTVRYPWDFMAANKVAKIFTPDGIGGSRGASTSKFTQIELTGTFMPSIPQFSGNRSVWEILQGFLNPVVNEMFTTLRVNADGNIVPTLVCRQQPFSSGLVSESYFIPEVRPIASASKGGGKGRGKKKGKFVGGHSVNTIGGYTGADGSTSVATFGGEVEGYYAEGRKQTGQHSPPPKTEEVMVEHKLSLTRFATLPRWVVHPVLVQSLDVGRSDAMRFNMIHVYGDSGTRGGSTPAVQFVRDPPIFDDLDILRNGIRSYSQVVPCSQADTLTYKSRDWMKIIADNLMGGHMRLTGTISMVGVQSPICVGDNLEFDDHLFHIETVSHSFQIAANGMKSFNTQIQLTYGIRGDDSMATDADLYAGRSYSDLREYDAQQSNDYQQPENAPSVPGSADTWWDENLSRLGKIKGDS